MIFLLNQNVSHQVTVYFYNYAIINVIHKGEVMESEIESSSVIESLKDTVSKLNKGSEHS